MNDDLAAGAGAAGDDHPNLEDLLSYAAGTTEGFDISHVTTHLAVCTDCAGVVARYQLAADTVRADAMIVPSPEVLARAKSLFSPGAAAAPTPLRDVLAPVRRVIAELIFDSHGGLTPSLAGFRGGGDRHVTFVAESVQIDLHVQAPMKRDGSWQIHGQVDALASGGSQVDIVQSGKEHAVARVRVDDQGIFALEAPAGRYDILVRLPDVIHVLPGLSFG